MPNNNYSSLSRGMCTIKTGSMTYAIKARRALAAEGINVRVLKLGDTGKKKGCVYGIEFPCSLSGNIRAVLSRTGISFE